MTRETKIGLLVGLAFIIVIGILLSDHLTSTTEPPQAQLVQAGKDVRTAVAVPGGAAAPVTQVQVPQQISPQAPVATREELQPPKQQPVAIVQIGPAPTPPTANPPAPQPAPQQPRPEQVVTNTPPADNTTPAPQPNDATNKTTLENVANLMKEPVVPAGQATPNNQPPATPPAPPTTPVVAGKTYKVETGDSLSKIAARFYGSNTKANRQLIIDANPSLKANPDVVVVGRNYTIPAAPATPAAPAPQIAQTPAPANTPAAQPVAPKTPKLAPDVVVVEDPKAKVPAREPASNEHYYVVKSGETLTRIAREQMGTPDAVSAIVELNKISNPDKVVAGTKLRLPAKPVAVATTN
ncbi:MAG TPA: LysM peptidoglycan-binding domain-containing protein [Tepidisphaeraceae bacterium]|jgi:LysM repeat protein